MGSWTAGVAEALRVTFRREELPPPEAPGAADRPAPARGAPSLLFAPEPLPPDLPALRPRAGRWLAWFFSPESLDP